MSAAEAKVGWTAPTPRRKGRSIRLLRRYWWIWLLAVPGGALLLWDWDGGGRDWRRGGVSGDGRRVSRLLWPRRSRSVGTGIGTGARRGASWVGTVRR